MSRPCSPKRPKLMYCDPDFLLKLSRIQTSFRQVIQEDNNLLDVPNLEKLDIFKRNLISLVRYGTDVNINVRHSSSESRSPSPTSSPSPSKDNVPLCREVIGHTNTNRNSGLRQGRRQRTQGMLNFLTQTSGDVDMQPGLCTSPLHQDQLVHNVIFNNRDLELDEDFQNCVESALDSLLRLLTSEGTDINCPEMWGDGDFDLDPLHVDGVKGRIAILKQLLRFGCDTNHNQADVDIQKHGFECSSCSDFQNSQFLKNFGNFENICFRNSTEFEGTRELVLNTLLSSGSEVNCVKEGRFKRRHLCCLFLRNPSQNGLTELLVMNGDTVNCF